MVGAVSALPSEVTATIESTATGGDIFQEAYNYVGEAGDDTAYVVETITMDAEGTGEVIQTAVNEAGDDGGIYGEGAIVTQSITMDAVGTDVWQNYGYYEDWGDGYYYWEPGNYAWVYGDGAIVTQSLSMDATGENIWQNYGDSYYYGELDGVYYWPSNYAEVYGVGTTTTQTIDQTASAEDYVYQVAWNEVDPDAGSIATQSIEQTAVAGGDIDQAAANEAYFYGDGAVAIQSVLMDASAGGYADQYGNNYADMHGDFGYMNTMVDQSATLNAIAGDWVYQYFYNDIPYATGGSVNDQAITMSGTAGTDVDQYLANYIYLYGGVTEDTQLLDAAASAADGYVDQYAYNEIEYSDYAYSYGNDLGSQSIYLSGIASDDVYQYGENYADLADDLVLGQLVYLAGDGSWVDQYAYNDAWFGDTATIAQALGFSAISDDEGVTQYGQNYAENYWAYGGSTNSIGQSISAAATGGDYSVQDLYNIADTWWNVDSSVYDVTQSNVATLSANDEAYQYMNNWIYWWGPNTGSVAMDILGDASADYVYQYHENWIG
ncbi:MAG TPA: hypothetical protein PLK36_07975 [Methanoregulaceae archaeon]|nr:hypothetical protein [Methanoregulaceae archaeon]